MGKVRSKRHQFHLQSLKGNFTKKPFKNSSQVPNYETVCNKNERTDKIHITTKSNIFKNVTIPSNVLNQKLPDFPESQGGTELESIKYERYIGRKNLLSKCMRDPVTKKRIRQGKKIPFVQVLEAAALYRKQKLEQKKKKDVAVLGNYEALKDALPTLEDLIKEKVLKSGEDKPRVAKSFKRQDQERMKDIANFHEVLQNPSFSSDPFSTISTHLKLKLEAECK